MSNFKKNLVLIHGHGMNQTIWEGVHSRLNEEFRIIVPNFALFTNFETVEEYADELYQYLTNVGITKCTVVGHSMGGYIALAFAEKYPDMIEGFGLFHSIATADDEAKKEQRTKMIELLKEKSSADFIRLTGPNMFGSRFRESYTNKIKDHVEKFAKLPSEALAAGVNAIKNRPDRTHVLRDLNVPLLLIVGMEDLIMPFDKVIEMSGYAKESYPFILSDAGHMGMVERTDTSVKILRWYMEKI